MRNILLVLFVFIFSNANSNANSNEYEPCKIINEHGETFTNVDGFWYATRYATVSGGGDGTTTSSTWTLTQAASNAVAGDLVYVRSGAYGNINITFANDGSANNEIRFIGTNSSWEAIVTTSNPTYKLEESFSGNDIPFLDGGLQDGQRASNGTGFTISGDYVHLENFAIRGFERGVNQNSTSSHITLKNINTDFMGDMREDNVSNGFTYYLGRGVNLDGSHALYENSFDRDADAQGLSVGGEGNHNIKNFYSYTSSDIGNTVDYQFLIQSDDNIADGVYMTREVGTIHLGHGIVFKPNGVTAANNLIENFILINLRVEIQFARASNNIVRNGQIINTSGRSGTVSDSDYAATEIVFANGAHDNLVENVYMFEPTWGISNKDWGDGASNSASDDAANHGYNNTVNNIVVDNPRVGHLQFSGASNEYGTENSAAQNFRVINCTFIEGVRLFYGLNYSGNATGGIYNSLLIDVPNFLSNQGSGGIASAFIFNYMNNSNSFATSSYTPYAESNISTTTVSLEDVRSSNTDMVFDYTPTADITGGNFSNILSSANKDANDFNRVGSYTIGALEFDSQAPDPPGLGTPTSGYFSSILNFFVE